MGIPSYFSSLIKRYPKLISHCPPPIDWLWIDFNCIVYHCLNGLGDTVLPPYYGESRKDEWESLLIKTVEEYCKKIIKDAGPQKGVYIAVDGVVPMAKMKQQRLRRFRGGQISDQTKWDKNSITPGTLFMNKLQVSIKRMADSHFGWRFSSSHECGEGEHKIMEQWRTGKYDGNYALYGLDADLVVLSLLNRNNNNVWLFREEIKSKEVSGRFCWFDISRLSEILFGNNNRKIKDYCFAMSFLGNDFVPSSLSMKIKENGYQLLVDTLNEKLWKHNIFLIEEGGIDLCLTSLRELIKQFAEVENERVEKFIRSKTILTNRVFDQEDEEWKPCDLEEGILVIDGKLVGNWREKYLKWFGSADETCIEYISTEYLKSLVWTWMYYNGKPVCNNWFYAWNLPPLWNWLENTKCAIPCNETIIINKGEISEQEQLCLVLPLKSWSLITDNTLKKMPSISPWMFPHRFDSFCIGKYWKWEEEPKIPIVSVSELKKMNSQTTSSES